MVNNVCWECPLSITACKWSKPCPISGCTVVRLSGCTTVCALDALTLWTPSISACEWTVLCPPPVYQQCRGLLLDGSVLGLSPLLFSTAPSPARKSACSHRGLPGGPVCMTIAWNRREGKVHGQEKKKRKHDMLSIKSKMRHIGLKYLLFFWEQRGKLSSHIISHRVCLCAAKVVQRSQTWHRLPACLGMRRQEERWKEM